MTETTEAKSAEPAPFRNMTWATLGAIIAILTSLANASVSITNFAVRLDRLEQTDKAYGEMLKRHETNLTSLQQMDARLARIEARLDMLVERRAENGGMR